MSDYFKAARAKYKAAASKAPLADLRVSATLAGTNTPPMPTARHEIDAWVNAHLQMDKLSEPKAAAIEAVEQRVALEQAARPLSTGFRGAKLGITAGTSLLVLDGPLVYVVHQTGLLLQPVKLVNPNADDMATQPDGEPIAAYSIKVFGLGRRDGSDSKLDPIPSSRCMRGWPTSSAMRSVRAQHGRACLPVVAGGHESAGGRRLATARATCFTRRAARPSRADTADRTRTRSVAGLCRCLARPDRLVPDRRTQPARNEYRPLPRMLRLTLTFPAKLTMCPW